MLSSCIKPLVARLWQVASLWLEGCTEDFHFLWEVSGFLRLLRGAWEFLGCMLEQLAFFQDDPSSMCLDSINPPWWIGK